MFPILFKIPLFGLFGRDFFPIHTYGVMMAIGFLVGSWYVARQARRQGEDPAQAMDLIFYILIAGIIGSRVLHVLVADREAFFQNPFILFKIWEGGLVFYGGFLGAFLTSFWYLRKHRLPVWKTSDFFAPAIALGHAIGRIGCFMTGCCYGRPVLEPRWYTVIFPPGGNAPSGVPLIATQLIESGAEFLIFLGLAWALPRKKFDGQIIALYLIVYAATRFWLEFWRGDTDRGTFFDGSISTSQMIAILLFLSGAWLYRRQSRASGGIAR